MGDYLRPLGVRTALVGKTHMTADKEGMERLGIDPKSIIGVRVSECGFDPYERDDGLHARGPDGGYARPSATLQQLSQRQGLSRRQSLARLGQCGAGREQQARLGLGDAPCAQAGAGEGGGFRDALHDPARHRFHPRGRRQAVVPASVLHQAALALYRAGALQHDVQRRRTSSRSCARRRSATIRTR